MPDWLKSSFIKLLKAFKTNFIDTLHIEKTDWTQIYLEDLKTITNSNLNSHSQTILLFINDIYRFR